MRSLGYSKVQIIFHYNKSDDAKDVLLTVEEFYMRKLCTLRPFGLNDNITSMNINLNNYDLLKLNSLNTPFFSFPSERRKRGHGHKKYSKQKVSSDDLKSMIETIFGYIESYQVHNLYVYLRSLSRQIINHGLENLDEFCKNHPAKLHSVQHILLSYRSQYVKPPKTVSDSFIYCTIPFVHKVIERMGIREIFKCKEVNAYLPHAARKFKIRTTFSYGPTLGKKY